jgi:hypothetical protein
MKNKGFLSGRFSKMSAMLGLEHWIKVTNTTDLKSSSQHWSF